jgi:serine/threonine protein kinase
VDQGALDLMKKMLQVNPSQRWSAEECLRHPYFGGRMEVEEAVLNTNTMMEEENTSHSIPFLQKHSSTTVEPQKETILKAMKLSKRNSETNSEFLSAMKKEDYSKPPSANRAAKLKLIYNDNTFTSPTNKENMVPISQLKMKDSQNLNSINISMNRSFGGHVYQNTKDFNGEA